METCPHCRGSTKEIVPGCLSDRCSCDTKERASTQQRSWGSLCLRYFTQPYKQTNFFEIWKKARGQNCFLSCVLGKYRWSEWFELFRCSGLLCVSSTVLISDFVQSANLFSSHLWLTCRCFHVGVSSRGHVSVFPRDRFGTCFLLCSRFRGLLPWGREWVWRCRFVLSVCLSAVDHCSHNTVLQWVYSTFFQTKQICKNIPRLDKVGPQNDSEKCLRRSFIVVLHVLRTVMRT